MGPAYLLMSQRSIATSLNEINEKIKDSHQKYCLLTGKSSREPSLVAVSKTKPNEVIEEAYRQTTEILVKIMYRNWYKSQHISRRLVVMRTSGGILLGTC